MNHQNIVKFEHFFEDENNVYILLEMCPNQTLADLMRRRWVITEFESRYYLKQVIAAIKYMHQHHVLHRDLKLGNLFLDARMQIKIGDFGLAT
jgi:polo-like kinase 1